MSSAVQAFFVQTNDPAKVFKTIANQINSWASANGVKIISASVSSYNGGGDGDTIGWVALVVYEK